MRVTRHRAAETVEERAARLTCDAMRVTRRRAAETDEERAARLTRDTRVCVSVTAVSRQPLVRSN